MCRVVSTPTRSSLIDGVTTIRAVGEMAKGQTIEMLSGQERDKVWSRHLSKEGRMSVERMLKAEGKRSWWITLAV